MIVGALADYRLDDPLGMTGGRSTAARAALAASLSELYFRAPSERSTREQEMMAEMLQDLIRDVDTCMRDVLTRAAAPRRIPASDMARVLGSDDVDEVRITLRESPNLTDDDLLAIARRRPDAYRRAIAERDGLSTHVTDAIIGLAGVDVILRLLANPSAKISSDAIELLLSRSADAPALRALLMERPELTNEQLQRLGPAPRTPRAIASTLPKWLRRNTAEGFA